MESSDNVGKQRTQGREADPHAGPEGGPTPATPASAAASGSGATCPDCRGVGRITLFTVNLGNTWGSHLFQKLVTGLDSYNLSVNIWMRYNFYVDSFWHFVGDTVSPAWESARVLQDAGLAKAFQLDPNQWWEMIGTENQTVPPKTGPLE